VSFSKPVRKSSAETLPVKRKRTLNPKLASEDNVHQDAVKRRKLNAQAASTSKNLTPKPATYSSSRQPSVEEEDDVDDHATIHAGPPKNPNNILENSDGSDDDDEIVVIEDPKENEKEEETDEQELGNLKLYSITYSY
jgi:hypothetical protein